MSEEQERDSIIEAAKKEAQEIVEKAKQETEELLAKAESLIEQKIEEKIEEKIYTNLTQTEEEVVVDKILEQEITSSFLNEESLNDDDKQLKEEDMEKAEYEKEINSANFSAIDSDNSNEKLDEDSIAKLFAAANSENEEKVEKALEPEVKRTPEKYKKKAKRIKNKTITRIDAVKKHKKTKIEIKEEKESRKAQKESDKLKKKEEREKLKEQKSQERKENIEKRREKKREKKEAKKAQELAKKNVGKEKQPKTNPEVCIVLATYNPQMNVLEELLQSLNEQNYKNINLVICDDCSETFNEEELSTCVKECITQFPFEVHRNDEKLGIDKTYEKLIQLAKGDYIAICRQEDIWLQGKIKRYIVEIEENQYALVCTDIIVIDDEGDDIAESICKINKGYVFKQGEGLAEQLLFDNFVISGTMMVKSSLAKEALPFCPVMNSEHYLALYVAKEGKIGFIGRTFTKHRFYSDDESLKPNIKDKNTYVALKINNC
ncbi:MAG: glycosyltransferase, partial [Aminipila sp.]